MRWVLLGATVPSPGTSVGSIHDFRSGVTGLITAAVNILMRNDDDYYEMIHPTMLLIIFIMVLS